MAGNPADWPRSVVESSSTPARWLPAHLTFGNNIRTMKRTVIILLCVVFLLGVLGFTAPGPVEGVWKLQVLQCACTALTVAEFESGSATVYSEHTEESGPMGSYQKSDDGWIWTPHAGGHELLIQPRWFTLSMTDLTTHETFSGVRVVWPPTVKYARTLQNEDAEQDGDGDA